MVFKNLSKNSNDITSIRKGIIRTKNLSAELDSATVVLTQIPKRNDLEPYDKIKLTENGLDEYWMVANITWQIVKKETPLLYDYTIDLCELTKILETITMPNMAITNIGQNRSVWFYVNNAIKMYFHDDVTNEIDFDNTTGIGQLLDETICPEMTFSQPTLREYIDFFFNIKGYRCKLIYNGSKYILTGIDYNLRKLNQFPLNKCDNIVGSQSSVDYVTQLSSEITNVVNPETIVEYHKLKSESGYFTSDTASLVLDYKPYDIKKVELLYLSDNAQVTIRTDNSVLSGLGMAILEIQSIGFYKYICPFEIQTDDGYRDKYSTIINDPDGTTSYHINTNSGAMGVTMKINPIANITENLVTSEIYNGLRTLHTETYKRFISNAPDLALRFENYANNSLIWNRGSREIINLFNYRKANTVFEADDETPIEYAYFNGICANFIKEKASGILKGYVYEDQLGYVDNEAYFQYREVGSFTYDNREFICAININSLSPSFISQAQYKKIRFRVEYQPYIEFKMIQRQPNKNHLIEMNNSTTNAKTDLLSFYNQSKEKNNQLGNEAITFFGHSNENQVIFELGQTVNLDGSLYVLNTLEYTTKNDLILYKGTLSKDFSNQNINTILNREKRYYALPNTNESVDRHVLFETPTLYGAFTNPNYRIGVSIYDKNDNFIGSTPVNRVTLETGVTVFSFAFMDNVSLNIIQSDEHVSKTKIYKCEYVKYVDENGETDFLKFILYAKSKAAQQFDEAEYDYRYDVRQDADQMNKYEFTTPNYFLKDSRERLIITLNKL